MKFRVVLIFSNFTNKFHWKWGSDLNFTNVFPHCASDVICQQVEMWPGNFPSWKFPRLPSALNQCRRKSEG